MSEEQAHKDFKYSLLKEYLKGMPSEERERQIIEWIDEPELRFKMKQSWFELWKEAEEESVTAQTDPEDILGRIHHRIRLEESGKANPLGSGQSRKSRSLNSILLKLSRVAAILMIPLLGYLSWEELDQRMWKNGQVEVVYNEIICPLGSRSRFELPDGTTGWLNNGSRLKYPGTFAGNLREVELCGEAYFDVRHSKNRPFLVRTDELVVKVLGTKLNVHAYPGDTYQAITLESGKIELLREENGKVNTLVKMTPGQHAVFQTNSNKLELAKNENLYKGKDTKDFSIREGEEGMYDLDIETLENYTSWKDGKLVLRNDPLPLMLKRIERWYNVKFHWTDPTLSKYRYWATFEEENLDQVLQMLSLTGPIRFEKLPRESNDDGSLKPQEINVLLKI